MDVYVTLRFHHGGQLQQKSRIKYEGELGEVLGRTFASVGEDLGRASAGVGEDLGRDSVSVGEDLGGTSYSAAAFDIPEVGSDWESEKEASDDSDNADLPDEGEDEYGSDVHEEESSQTFEGSEGLGFEEAARPEKPFVGEVLGRNSASVGEDLGRVSVGVGEDLGRDSVGVGEDLDGTSSAAAASDIPEVGSDWESEKEASDDSDNADLPDEGEDEYGSDVHEEVINLRKEKRAAKRKKRKEKGPRSEGVDLDLKEKLIWDMMNIYPRNKNYF
uniref:GI15087 n=1 Tax=Solanum tuberosum TaxID=4113 RepID=M1DSH7_SOLTU